MRAKLMLWLLIGVLAPWGVVFGDWEIYNPRQLRLSTDTPREGSGTKKGKEREFLTLLDRGLGGAQRPVDYRGRIQLIYGYGTWEDDSEGTWDYEKLVANLFGHDRHVYGLTAKHATYDGDKTSETPRYEFEGEEWSLGPSYEYRNFEPGTWFTGMNVGGTIGYSLLETSGRKSGYFKDEEADILAGDLYTYLHRQETDLIQRFSVDVSFRHELESLMRRNSWEGDTPGNRTYREAKLRAHTRRFLWDAVSLNAGVKLSYEADRHFEHFGPVAGVTLFDSIYAEGEAMNGISDAPYKTGWGVSVDAVRFVPQVWRFVCRVFGRGRTDTAPVESEWQIVPRR